MPNTTQRSIVKLSPHPAMVDQLEKQIVQNGGLKIVGFGIFKLQKMKPKKGFNPYSKEYQDFPEYIKINFTPSKRLKGAIQKWK